MYKCTLYVTRDYNSWSYSFSDNITQPRILLNSTGIGILSLKNVNISNAGVYLCSTKNSVTREFEVQVSVDTEAFSFWS
jgi:hypothetical protein